MGGIVQVTVKTDDGESYAVQLDTDGGPWTIQEALDQAVAKVINALQT